MNAVDRWGGTALFYAAAFGRNRETVAMLLKAGADVNRRTEGGAGVLIAVARKNPMTEIAELLIEAGADVNAADEEGETPLLVAALFTENPAIINVLLNAGADARKTLGDGGSAADLAALNPRLKNTEVHRRLRRAGMAFVSLCMEGAPDEVALALRNGVDVEERTADGETPLMLAAAFNSSIEVVEMLLDAGARVNARNNRGRTALMYAAQYNGPRVVEMLLEAGADPSVRTVPRGGGMEYAKHAAHYAAANPKLKGTTVFERLRETLERRDAFLKLCREGAPAQIQAAIDGGADVNASEHTVHPASLTPLMQAASRNPDPEAARTLMRAGAAVDSKNEAGWTALFWSAMYNPNPRMIDALVDGGAEIDARNIAGWTPLMLAAANNPSTEVIDALLRRGADHDARNPAGATPLMLAAGGNTNPEAAELLLKSGADPSPKDGGGRSALDYAERNRALKGTRVLEELRKSLR